MRMSIPKRIHFCWFGDNPKPALAQKCISSWKRLCPDYEIIEWNEDNFDIFSCPLYVQQAYASGKWAFVTDYVRLKVVYEHGGVYLDTDVELKRSLDPLLVYHAYFGFEDGVHIATGLGFGAVAGHPVIKAMMDDYETIPFIKEDGTLDQETCPSRNTKILLQCGLQQDDSLQILEDNILILPSIYLCPISFVDGSRKRSKDTISIHWFSASWNSKDQHAERAKRLKYFKQARFKRKFRNTIHLITHLPHILLRKLLGDTRYEEIKALLKR